MSTITQDVPNFLNGISQQPDKKKIPTQVKDAVNTYPDYALGMLKRPGGKFVSNLYNAENINTTITTGTHNGVTDNSRTVGRYNSVAATGGSGSGATFNVHAQAAGEVATFTHNGVTDSSRTAGTYYVANAAGSASGTGADFKVIVDADGKPDVYIDNRTGKTGGAGYNASGETITIADSSLGNGGGAAVVLTITAIYSKGVEVKTSSGGKGYVVGDTLSIADSVMGSGGGAAITVTVTETGTYGKWFSILRDEDEKYVGQYADDTFRVWSLTDGGMRKVDMGSDTGVPSGCNYTNMQTDLKAYLADITDTDDATTELNSKQATFAETNDGQKETRAAYWETQFDYDPQKGTVKEEIKSGIYKSGTNNTWTVLKWNSGTSIADIKSMSDGAISGPVLTLERVSGGTGYSATTAATTSSGSGTGLTITYTVTGGVIDQLVTIATAGGTTATTGYKLDEVITVSGGGGNATFKVIALTYKAGLEMTDEHPTLAAEGKRLYELVETTVAANTAAELTTATNNMGTAQTAYNSAVTAEASTKSAYDSEVTNCVIPGLPNDGYLRGAEANDIELLTLNDYTYVLNKKKTVAMKAMTTDALATDAFVVIYVVGYNAKYEVIVNGVTISFTTAEDATAGDADVPTVVAGLVTNINAAGGAAANCVATAVGSGIHITLVTSITASGGPQESAIYCFIDKVSDLGKLPVQCHDGMKVKIVNSESILADDMWVKFSTSGTATNGVGAWEESNAPEIEYQFDPLTMPHQLVRQADGSFSYSAIDWVSRDVGDDVTNPLPTFVGSTIRNMFFYRNRFGFLSGGNCVMSKAASFYDFFAGSAQVASADDPIDISASSTKPVFLNYVKTTSAGLVLFSDNEQFLLSTDSDILSPETAKINTLAAFECDTNISAVDLGSSIAFVSKSPLWSRVFEIANISTTDPPSTFNTTGIVPELVPSDIDNVVSSPGMSMLSLGKAGDSTLYQYRFYQTSEGRKASTWYKWDLTGTLVDQFFDTSTFYAIVSDGTNVSINSIDLRQASDEGFLTLPTGEKTDVCMDMYTTNPYRIYPSSGVLDKTRVYLPFTHHAGKKLAVVALGGYIGGTLGATEASVGAIIYPTVAGSAPNQYVDIDGDYRGKNLILGYVYTMTVDLPKLYYSPASEGQAKNDYTSDLIIHRIKISTGLSGPVKYNVNLTGIPNRSETVSAIMPYTYTANDVAMAAESVHDVPVYQRNNNISLSIVGDTPLPVSLLGMTWEGKYNKKFYSRA
jgi:hypothetical protein